MSRPPEGKRPLVDLSLRVRHLGRVVTTPLLGSDRVNRLVRPVYRTLDRRATRRAVDRLPTSGLLVNLGCGSSPLAGWVNVDIARGDGADLVWDVREGLPFATGSCEAVFSEHLIEHVTRQDAQRLLRECWRVLGPGGVIRISTPDGGRYLAAYSHDHDFLLGDGRRRDADTAMDRINILMREGGHHLWIYDDMSLTRLMVDAQFRDVRRVGYRESRSKRFQAADDSERAWESMYLEGER